MHKPQKDAMRLDDEMVDVTVINASTGEVFGSISCDRSTPFDEIIRLAGGEELDEGDPRWSKNHDNVVFPDGRRWWYDDLAVVESEVVWPL